MEVPEMEKNKFLIASRGSYFRKWTETFQAWKVHDSDFS